MSRVLRSDDDQLFLTGGSNDVMRLYDDAGFAELVPIESWRERLVAREAFFARLGIPWRLLLAPEKLSVSGDAVLPPDAIPPGERLIRRIRHRALVYPRDYLRQQRAQGYVVYPRTDSHWTTLGAFSALQWLASALGIELDYAPFLALPALRMSYRGDLWGEGYEQFPEDIFERRQVPDSIARIHANPIVLLKERLGRENEPGLHVGSQVAFHNPSAQRHERVVLFGTSFSDYRLDCALLTFLAALFFRDVHFIWSTDLDPALIERLGPDLAILEMPERFLPICPTDRFATDSHATQLVRAWNP